MRGSFILGNSTFIAEPVKDAARPSVGEHIGDTTGEADAESDFEAMGTVGLEGTL